MARLLTALFVSLVLLAGCSSGSGSGSASTSTSAPPPTAALEVTSSSTLDEALAASLDEAFAAVTDDYDVPGGLVMVSVPDAGEWEAEAGVADVEEETPVGDVVAWPVRSITKSFVVTALLQLVDEGAVSLDDTVDQYVDGVPSGDRITLRMLADMSSGLGEYAGSEGFGETFADDPDHQFTLEELNEYGLAEPVQFEPGTEIVYSNTNTNVLGAVIEAIAGQPIGEVLEQRVFGPAGLDETTYVALDADAPSSLPTGYQPGDDGSQEPQPSVFTIFGPSGGVVSTPDDLARWARVLATDELLGSALQQERQLVRPLDEGPEYDGYGLGIGEIDGWYGHTGEGLGVTALVMHHEASGATAVIFMNTSNAADGRHPPTVLFQEIAAILDDAGLVPTS